MTDDTIAHPDTAEAAAPSAVTAEAPADHDTDSSRPSGAGVVLVEEISIDGMCGVY